MRARIRWKGIHALQNLDGIQKAWDISCFPMARDVEFSSMLKTRTPRTLIAQIAEELQQEGKLEEDPNEERLEDCKRALILAKLV